MTLLITKLIPDNPPRYYLVIDVISFDIQGQKI